LECASVCCQSLRSGISCFVGFYCSSIYYPLLTSHSISHTHTHTHTHTRTRTHTHTWHANLLSSQHLYSNLCITASLSTFTHTRTRTLTSTLTLTRTLTRTYSVHISNSESIFFVNPWDKNETMSWNIRRWKPF